MIGEPVVVSESNIGKLCIHWDEYKSQMYLHIRYWYEDKKSGEWKPGVKGIAIHSGNVANVIAGMKQLLERSHE